MNEKIESGTMTISLRLDKNLKKDAEDLFSEIGMNMTTAINIFLRHCLMENKIPFEIGLRGDSAGPMKIKKASERTKTLCGEMTFDELCGLVAPIARKHGVNRMYLFGSRARGDNREDSDFDFCIDVPKSFSLMDIGGLMGELEDAVGAKVDLLCENDMHKKPRLMEEVLRDRKLVFG
ncbi:MAG: type II toxin-antitoxin system RelB/DinJ family antitoxin [Methanomassiliicoccaceae archaeon]|jgi:addiction module RelB/DinJ family antitoxin|nr:type II toxin-antitoxin system RelB/DinJ family antitoxin [Methanomassiliicoccaceae archaeon]